MRGKMMTTIDILKVFGLSTSQPSRILPTDQAILDYIKVCKGLYDNFDKMYEDSESEDNEII